jgi:hypothetical protein
MRLIALCLLLAGCSGGCPSGYSLRYSHETLQGGPLKYECRPSCVPPGCH